MKKSIIQTTVLCLVWLTSALQGCTADWQSVSRKLQAKYKDYDAQIYDVTIVSESNSPFDLETKTPGNREKPQLSFQDPGKHLGQATLMEKRSKIRIEMRMDLPILATRSGEQGDFKIVIIHDGVDDWLISPVLGKVKNPSNKIPTFYGNVNWWDSITEGTLVGSEEIGGKDCYLIGVPKGEKSPFKKVWIDKQDLVLVKAEISEDIEAKTTTVLHSDFRKIKGDWLIPYKTEIYSDEALIVASTVKSVEVNQGLSDDLFDPDKVEVTGFNINKLFQGAMSRKESMRDRKTNDRKGQKSPASIQEMLKNMGIQ